MAAPRLDWTVYSNIIDGKPQTASQTRQGTNPATKELLPPVPVSAKEDLDLAVAAARKAFTRWAATSWEDRAKALVGFHEALLARADEFGESLCREVGKPIQFAKREAIGAAYILKGVSALKLDEEVVFQDGEKTIVKRYLPLGVAGLIVPWNYPLILMTTKLAPAVLAGNTVVCKPSPFTPYTGLKLVELAQSFFPPGVINIVSGNDDLGPWMTNHPDINKISFTGSTATGRKVMEGCSKTLKRVTLELGGKDASILLPSPPSALPLLASQLARHSFLNTSQICMAIKRLFIPASIAEEFLPLFLNAIEGLKIGNPAEQETFLGPIQNELQYNRVKEFIQHVTSNAGQGKEGKIVLQSSIPEEAETRGGFFLPPTVVLNPSPTSKIQTEEPFGPILPVTLYNDIEEAITMANDSEYGLGASVWGSDVEEAEKVGRRLQAGIVWINEHIQTHTAAPFGGWKNSGMGYEYGKEGLVGWSNVQSLFVRKEVKALL